MIETKRLVLRPLRPADAPAVFDAIQTSREALKRRLCWVEEIRKAGDEEDAILQFDEARERGKALVCGVFDNHKHFLGVVSLKDLETAHASRAEVGGWIRADSQDKGYGGEAIRALCEYAFSELELHRLYGRIDPTNRPSRRVLKKLKFKYEGTLREEKKLNGRWIPQECWGLLKSEWQKQPR